MRAAACSGRDSPSRHPPGPPTRTDPPTVDTDDAPGTGTQTFDETHTYTLTHHYDHGGRPTSMDLPTDPDWTLMGGTGSAPPVEGDITYDARGLPYSLKANIDGTDEPIIHDISYAADGQMTGMALGDTQGNARSATTVARYYDSRRRPSSEVVTREATAMEDPMTRPLGAVTEPFAESYTWDAADNLIGIQDDRLEGEWPDGYRPAKITIGHDALYRVTHAEYSYKQDDGSWGVSASNIGTDWRAERTRTNADSSTHQQADPMREDPAPMAATLPSSRVVDLTYAYDWLANMTEWTDDSQSFYERSLGTNIGNGQAETGKRPSALYFATNIDSSSHTINTTADRGGWVKLDYGDDGNVVAMTVRAQCHDTTTTACYDPGGTFDNQDASLRASCTCAVEQHYQYRWDELNRLAEARRYDRAGSGNWTLAVRQRYRYDAGNQRVIKQTWGDSFPDRTALYVYPGDYERDGLVDGVDHWAADGTLGTETQYLIGGARIVWKHHDPSPTYALARDVRMTYALSNLIGSTSAVLDLYSGELLEYDTYYPNGAQETERDQSAVSMQPEPLGFTGKEADSEVGVAYFGERYLIPRVGRWASTPARSSIRVW